MPVKVLLVDDDPTAGRLVEAALLEAACDEIWIKTSCEAALELVHRDRFAPDLVILDLATHDPQAVAPFLRHVKRLRDVPVVVIADADAIGAAVDSRVVEYVMRPVRPAELVARIRAALRLRVERTRRRARERSLTENIRRLERDNQHLERLVCVDALTGIANRRHVLALLHAESKRSERDRTPISVVMIDLDEFHAFNERYGHLGGDACLRRVAGAMVACLRRPSDFLGRYGGEEFVAILANTDAAGARLVAERLRATVAALAIPHERSPHAVVTVSVGFATAQPSDVLDAGALVAAADGALLQAKALGRDRVAGDAPPAPPRASEPTASVRFPIVTVDPWFADRIPEFLIEARHEATAIHAARRARHFERIRSLGKKLRLTARGYGLDEMGDLAGELERAARLADRAAIRRAAEGLEQYVTHVQVVYRRRTDAMAIAVPLDG